MASRNPDGHGSYGQTHHQQEQEPQSTLPGQAPARFNKDEEVFYRRTLSPDQWHSLTEEVVVVIRSQQNLAKYHVRPKTWQRPDRKETLTVESDRLVNVPPVLLQPFIWDKIYREYVRPAAVRFGPNNEILELRVWRWSGTLSPNQWRVPQLELSPEAEILIYNQEQAAVEQDGGLFHVAAPPYHGAVKNIAPSLNEPPAAWGQLWNLIMFSTTDISKQNADPVEVFRPTTFESEPGEPRYTLPNLPSMDELTQQVDQRIDFSRDPRTGERSELGLEDLID